MDYRHVSWVLALGPPTIAGLWDLEDTYFDANASAERKALLDKNLAQMKAEPTTPDFVRAYRAKAADGDRRARRVFEDPGPRVPIVMWTDELKKRIKALTVEVFPKSGHYIPIEERETFDRDFTRWLGHIGVN